MKRAEHLFVVRIWREATAGHAAWRGSVKDVESDQRVDFSKFADLVDFIALRSGASVPGSENQSAASQRNS
jgi:hypothetical protein